MKAKKLSRQTNNTTTKMTAPIDLGYTTPGQTRNLRACMVCSIVQLYTVRLPP
jgi:hypothetical protein